MTGLAKINAARNETFQAMTFAEIEAAANNALNGTGCFPHNAKDVAILNAKCAEFNQLMIEYHLARNEFSFAVDAAKDYFDAIS